MSKKLLLLLAAVLAIFVAVPMTASAAEGVAIDETNFPDAYFRNYVSANYDRNGDSILSPAEAQAVTSISFIFNSDQPLFISDMKGIEHFTELTVLDCSNIFGLKSLDVSQNTALTYLSCPQNQLSKLDVSNNPALIELDCHTNELTELIVNNNPALKTLTCYSNKLTKLDLSNAPALTELACTNNRLTTLDFEQPIQFVRASAQDSQLEIRRIGGRWTADFAELVGRENLGKVQVPNRTPYLQPWQWQYDATTGLAVCEGENIELPEMLVYYYNGNNFNGVNMSVTLRLSEKKEDPKPQPGANIVVMKFGATKAYADGKVAPTTQYANGYATVKNINSTAMVPLRYIAEVNGFDVVYDEESMKTKVINKATGEYLLITPGSNVVEKYSAVGDFISSTNAPAAFVIENDVTMGPQRFVCEALGLSVHYKWVADGEEYLSVTPQAITDEEFEALVAKAQELGL